MYCIVHFIITLFNVGNILLCVIYQLNLTVFMYVSRISRYIQHSVLCAVSRNRGRSWNVLPVDTGHPPVQKNYFMGVPNYILSATHYACLSCHISYMITCP